MKYKICEYERGNGEKYWIISHSEWGLLWTPMKQYRQVGMNYFSETIAYKTKEAAMKVVEWHKKEDAYQRVKRIKCEIV